MKPQRAEDFQPVPRKSPPTHCLYCKKEFRVGDRITPVYAIAGIGYDTQVNGRLPAVGPEYELAHFRCEDPQANGIALIISSGG